MPAEGQIGGCDRIYEATPEKTREAIGLLTNAGFNFSFFRTVHLGGEVKVALEGALRGHLAATLGIPLEDIANSGDGISLPKETDITLNYNGLGVEAILAKGFDFAVMSNTCKGQEVFSTVVTRPIQITLKDDNKYVFQIVNLDHFIEDGDLKDEVKKAIDDMSLLLLNRPQG